jgi:hypothetical protein
MLILFCNKQTDYEKILCIKNKELSHAKSQHFHEVRDLNKQILALKDEQSKLAQSLVISKSEHDYKVSLAVKGARRLERLHHSIEKEKVVKRSGALTCGSIVSLSFSSLNTCTCHVLITPLYSSLRWQEIEPLLLNEHWR